MSDLYNLLLGRVTSERPDMITYRSEIADALSHMHELLTDDQRIKLQRQLALLDRSR